MYNLPKAKRLYLRDSVSSLFAEGKSFVSYPYRVVYRVLPAEAGGGAYAMMAVAPKRRLKRAVDRNRVKRMTREAFRLNQLPLADATRAACCGLHVAFMYVGTAIPTFRQSDAAVRKAVARLQKHLSASCALSSSGC